MSDPKFVTQLGDAIIDDLAEVGIGAEVEYEPVRGTKLFRFYVVADAFAELSHSERQELVWRVADRALTEAQARRISTILTLTNEELGDEGE